MSDLTRRAARGTLLLMGAHGCLMASGYVIAVILARDLGPRQYGMYGIVYSVLISVELICRLGIPQAVSKLIAERRERTRRLEATGVTLTLGVYCAVFLAFVVGAPLLGRLFNVPDGEVLFRIAALDIPFYGMYFMLHHILNGHRRFAEESLATVIYALARVVGIVLLVEYESSVAGALVVNVAASTIALVFVSWRTGRHPFALTLAERRPIMALAIPVALLGFGTQMMQSIDLWVLNMLSANGVAETVKGFYVAALNLARIPTAAAFVMTAVLIPSIARAVSLNDEAGAQRSLRGATRFLLASLLPACALIAIESEGLTALVFSARYAPSAPLLAVLIFAHGFSYTVLLTLCAVLIGAGRARQAATLALSFVPMAAILDGLLITRFGAMGAAAGALLIMSAGALVALRAVHRAMGPPVEVAALVKIVAATAIVTLLDRLIDAEGGMLLFKLCVVIVIYAILLVAFRILTRDDLRPFLNVGETRE